MKELKERIVKMPLAQKNHIFNNSFKQTRRSLAKYHGVSEATISRVVSEYERYNGMSKHDAETTKTPVEPGNYADKIAQMTGIPNSVPTKSINKPSKDFLKFDGAKLIRLGRYAITNNVAKAARIFGTDNSTVVQAVDFYNANKSNETTRAEVQSFPPVTLKLPEDQWYPPAGTTRDVKQPTTPIKPESLIEFEALDNVKRAQIALNDASHGIAHVKAAQGISSALVIRCSMWYETSAIKKVYDAEEKAKQTQEELDAEQEAIALEAYETKPVGINPDELKYVITPFNVCFSWKGESYAADISATNFPAVVLALTSGDAQTAIDNIDVASAIEYYMKGYVVVEHGIVKYQGMQITGGMTSRIIDAMTSGDETKVSALVMFFNNLMENPSNRAVNELFGFLEANDIVLTEDGYFYAWKKVRANYKDIYTGTMDNSPGTMVSVPRNMVDENSEVTCSHGLHVCSKSYLGHFGNCVDNRVVRVKVHPRDVVAIPKDYNNSKMRCSGYYVVEDATSEIY